MGKLYDKYWSWHHQRVKVQAAKKSPIYAEIEARRHNPNGLITYLDEDRDLGWKEIRIQNEIEAKLRSPMHNWVWKLHHFWETYLSPKKYRRKIRWYFQRARRGYDDSNLWNFSFYLARIISEGTAWLAEHSHGYPGEETPESWAAKLTELSQLFNKLYQGEYDEIPGDFYEWQENTTKEQRREHYLKAGERREKDKERAFELLASCWDGLWD